MIAYTNKKNDWFDCNISKWWIYTVSFLLNEKLQGYGFPYEILLDDFSNNK